jgi:hypothetical protein
VSENPDSPGPLGRQAQYGAHQDRLAGPRSADETEDFPPTDVKVEILQDDLAAETDGHSPDGENDILLFRRCRTTGFLILCFGKGHLKTC